MKKLYWILVLIVFIGCIPEGANNDIDPAKTHEIIIIDGCEYIYVSRRPWTGDMSITHKGNCNNHKSK